MSQSKRLKNIYHYGFFFLKELEIEPTTFCHHTLKYHKLKMKIKQEKVSQNLLDLKWKFQIRKVHFGI
jgi:hypothetical protein